MYYLLQVFETSHATILVRNHTTNATNTLVTGLKAGTAYNFVVRGVTKDGFGPFSTAEKFSMPQGVVSVTGYDNDPAPTVEDNTYMIIAIVSAAVLVAIFLLAAIILICKKRNKKCPHYFSKANGGSGPWPVYAGFWENGASRGTHHTSTSTSGMNPRYANGAEHISSVRYGRPEKMGDPSLCSNSHFYDTKSGYEIRPTEDIMYEDPEGFHLVSFKKGHKNPRKCNSPEPYATTPLISGVGEPRYPRHNLPNILPASIVSHSGVNYSDKGSMCFGGPVLQFPPPPPSQGSLSTSTSSNGRSKTSNNGRSNESSGGSSVQHLFLQQHLPYHSVSDASHHTSPLVRPRQFPHSVSPNNNHQLTYQVPPNSSQLLGYGIDDVNNKYPPMPQSHINFIRNPLNNYQHPQIDTSDNFGRVPKNEKDGVCSWLNNASYVTNDSMKPNSPFNDGVSCSSRKCPSPQSSAPGDPDDSDDRDETSCWSDGGSPENESSVGSFSELDPNLDWAEAVRLMTENNSTDNNNPNKAAYNPLSSEDDEEKRQNRMIPPENEVPLENIKGVNETNDFSPQKSYRPKNMSLFHGNSDLNNHIIVSPLTSPVV